MATDRDEGPSRGRFALAMAAAIALGATLALGWLVAARWGNLAWDDADYVRRGLRLARLVEAGGPGALAEVVREWPKPPLLVAWIEATALALGRRNVGAILVAASALPFGLLLAAVLATARRFYSSAVALTAVLLVAASPLGLAFGAKVMVETFLGLWILASFALAALFLDRPSQRLGLALGAALGLAALTKMTVALLLPGPLLALAATVARTDRERRPGWKAWACVAIAALAVAGPWYARNAGRAVRFAVDSSRFNAAVEGRSDEIPRLRRLRMLAEQGPGWPALAVIAGAGAVALAGGRRRAAEPGGREPGPEAAFARFAVAGAAGGAAILMIPTYFDPRFLLPAWPALAVAVAGWMARSTSGTPAAVRALVPLGLAVGVGLSTAALLGEEARSTAWAARGLIDRLVAERGVATLGNLGDTPDWNVCKTGLINELRDDPASCFVLHDLSRGLPGAASRLARLDAVVVLDREAIPPAIRDGSPGLNRAYDELTALLPGDRFDRLAPLPLAGLPPLTVYVRRR